MTTNNQPLRTAHEAALSHAKSVALDQLRAADQLLQSSQLFNRNEPGYCEARLAIAQIIALNYISAISQTQG